MQSESLLSSELALLGPFTVHTVDIVHAVDVVHAGNAVDTVHALDSVHAVHTLDLATAIVSPNEGHEGDEVQEGISSST